MKTTVIAMLAATLFATAFVPGASAEDDPQCAFYPCDCFLGTVGCFAEEAYAGAKRAVDELDPRDWPCTCDPMPNPGP